MEKTCAIIGENGQIFAENDRILTGNLCTILISQTEGEAKHGMADLHKKDDRLYRRPSDR